jgi:phospholipid/cholesterol/gamma-HCH transport system permease protein
VAIAVSREMAAVITAVVMCGRTGAAFAAELAAMQTNEEIDAFAVLGLNPVDYLVLPRVLTLLVMLPLLYLFACVGGLLGGFAVSASLLDLAPSAYFERSVNALTYTHLGLGLSKSMAFGVLVAQAACLYGLHAERNATGVGQATTRAVVAGIVGVIALDAVFAVCADALGI